MLLFVRNSLTMSQVCAGAFSWCNNKSLFFHISGRLCLTFPQLSQNLAVKIPIDSLTRWNKLLMQNSSNVKKNDQHFLEVAVNLVRFFRSWRGRRLPLRRLLLCFWVITVQPCFITSYDRGQEVRITSNCSLQLGAHLDQMVSLIIVQEMRNKLCCNSTHVQFIY